MTQRKERLGDFAEYLLCEERSEATREKYLRCVGRFLDWLGGREISKDLLVDWKHGLTGEVATRNGAISAVNGFLSFIGRADCRVRQFRAQRRTYRSEQRELTRAEYERLVRKAEAVGSIRLARAIETIAATGIRVSELRYFTAEAVRAREITITNKGKTRTILLTKELAAKLNRYAKARGIKRGEIFVTRTGRSLRRTQLWAEMKALCRLAGVEPDKVFPHNLRHMFAVIHYRLYRDLAKLADLLGHSSVDTTRIYLVETGKEHRAQLEAMRLVL